MTSQPQENEQYETLDAIVGRRIHLLMWNKKLTQTQFAPRLGMHQSALAKKLRAQRGWSLDEIRSAATELGVSIAYLLGESDTKNPPRGDGPQGGATPSAEAGPKNTPSLYKNDTSNVRHLFGNAPAEEPLRKTA